MIVLYGSQSWFIMYSCPELCTGERSTRVQARRTLGSAVLSRRGIRQPSKSMRVLVRRFRSIRSNVLDLERRLEASPHSLFPERGARRFGGAR